MLHNAVGVNFSGKKRYEGVTFNVISVTRGWVGVNFPEKSVTQHLNGPSCRHYTGFAQAKISRDIFNQG